MRMETEEVLLQTEIAHVGKVDQAVAGRCMAREGRSPKKIEIKSNDSTSKMYNVRAMVVVGPGSKIEPKLNLKFIGRPHRSDKRDKRENLKEVSHSSWQSPELSIIHAQYPYSPPDSRLRSLPTPLVRVSLGRG